ncbi:MAG: Rpn family recombination-promoting nuclease/putative transposase [Clostridiales bacterium]|nr:Rpn family recombination-promoting nuclease/putative transposase [Clostridiales bacterium]
MSKSERLYPVITLCVYWGTKPWDGPKNLHEILDISPEMTQYKDRIGNYPLNLLEVRKIEDLDQYQGELKALLGFVKYQDNKDALGQFVDENTELFQSMSAETIYAMSVLGNSRELQARITQITNEGNNLEEVQVDMCQAIREMIEDGRMEGHRKGLEEGLEKGREEGREEDRTEGRIKTETLLNNLNLRLLEDERMEDLRRSLSDRNFQQALCREYALY